MFKSLECLRAYVALARQLSVSLKGLLILLVLNLASVAFEGIGLAMFLPILQFVQTRGDIEALANSARYWQLIADVTRALDIQLSLGLLLIVSFAALLARQAFAFTSACYRARLVHQSIHTLRQRAFQFVLRARSEARQDDLLGKAVNDVAVELPRAVNVFYLTVQLVTSAILALMYLTGAFVLSPVMAVISVLVVGLTGLFLTGIFRESRKLGRTLVESNRQFSTFLVERLQSLRLIRISGTENAELTNLTRLSESHRDKEVRLRTISAKLDVTVEPIAILICFIVLYLGYSHFNLPLETLGMFFVILFRLLPLVRNVAGVYQTIISQWGSVLVLEERLRFLTTAREPKGGKRIFAKVQSQILFSDVSYEYAGSEVPALSHLSLAIRANSLTAIAGPSGSGKSTLIDLIPRLRDPTSGSITIDGVPLTDFTVASLRAGVSFVSQTPFIFNVTVAEHIRYGRPEADDGQVRAAAELAGVGRFIDWLPSGYDTPCGEGGAMLSVGQRQRIDLARAILRGGNILILDEPTSALDVEAEEAFRDSLDRLRQRGDRTLIVVAHRLSTIADADVIAVLDQGRVIEIGNHQQLIRKNGWYANAMGQVVSRRAAVGAL